MIALGTRRLALIIGFKRQAEQPTGREVGQPAESWDICLQVYPLDEQMFLPSNLQVVLIDNLTGKVFMEKQSSDIDDYIQLSFTGESEDCFSIKLILEDTTITEAFVI